jgi:MFS family permease
VLRRDAPRSRRAQRDRLRVAGHASNTTALLIHLPSHATDAGIDAQLAAYLPASVALSSLFGKLAYSWVGDRVPERRWMWLAVLARLVGWLVLLGSPAYSWLLAIAIGNGLASGALLLAWNALVGRCFGSAAFARVMGLMRPVFAATMNLGAPAAGWIFDRSGSYTLAFQLFALLATAIALLPFWLRVPRARASAAA